MDTGEFANSQIIPIANDAAFAVTWRQQMNVKSRERFDTESNILETHRKNVELAFMLSLYQYSARH